MSGAMSGVTWSVSVSMLRSQFSTMRESDIPEMLARNSLCPPLRLLSPADITLERRERPRILSRTL